MNYTADTDSTENERTIALNILSGITDGGAYNAIALKNTLNRHARLDRSKRAFITELVNGVLRNLTLIDHIIEQFSKTPGKKIKPLVKNVLRQAVYEIIFMSTPDYAVCAESVGIIKKRGLSGLAPYTNGVLRNIAREGEGAKHLNLPDKTRYPAKYLAVFYSHPEWLAKRWLDEYGYAFTQALLEKNNEPPEVTICVNTLKTDRNRLLNELCENGASAAKSELCESALLIRGTGDIKKLSAYKKGMFHVQDISSQLAVKALAPAPGEIIADVCAAPGGKSFCAAYMMENRGKIVASDIYPHKITLINSGTKRLGITIVDAKARDSSATADELVNFCDRVLVDAPCTGLGLIRKKPDIKLNRRENDISALQNIQRGILRASAKYVKKGGVLLYSTCTLTKEENEDNASWFSNNFEFEQVETDITSLFPHIHGTDGFFIAKFRRVR